MTDVFSKNKRSQIMSRVKGNGTKPELAVRSALHRLGFRFRVHQKDLPGCPDIVLRKHRKIIFVHGCFWHGHRNCKRASKPSSNIDFWDSKLSKNIERDRRNIRELERQGWHCIVIWECETKVPSLLARRLENVFSDHLNHA